MMTMIIIYMDLYCAMKSQLAIQRPKWYSWVVNQPSTSTNARTMHITSTMHYHARLLIYYIVLFASYFVEKFYC